MFSWLTNSSQQKFEPVVQNEDDMELGVRPNSNTQVNDVLSGANTTSQTTVTAVDDKSFLQKASSYSLNMGSLTSMTSSVTGYFSQSELPIEEKVEVIPETYIGKTQYYSQLYLQQAITACISFLSFSKLPYTHRLVGCMMFTIAGAIMAFACFTSLPALIFGGAARFVVDYLIASLFFFMASLFIVPIEDQLRALSSPQKRIGSVIYVIGTILLVAATQWRYTRTVFVILPLFLMHVVCLTYHLGGFIPYGATFMNSMSSIATNMMFSK